MIDLKNRNIDKDGQVILNDSGILEILLSDQSLLKNTIVELTDETEEYNKWAKVFGLERLNFEAKTEINHKANQSNWIMPNEFLEFDIEHYVIGLCQNKEQLERTKLELELYKERNLLPLLRFITYLVSIMKSESIVWGVGRGSSVSSYVLFLIGLHKIDSIKYKLDIAEFLK